MEPPLDCVGQRTAEEADPGGLIVEDPTILGMDLLAVLPSVVASLRAEERLDAA